MKTCKKNLYRLLSLALCLALCMLPFSTAFAAGTVTGVTPTVDPATLTESSAAQTVTVSLDLAISGGTTVAARGAQYKLSLPDDWTLEGHTFPSGAMVDSANATAGMWALASGSVDISSIGTLVLGVPANTAAGTYDISFSDIKVNDADNNSLIANATATATVTVKAPVAVEGYGVELTSDVTEIAEGGDISVYLDVTNDDVSTFNAFYAVLNYDSAKVAYSGGDTVDDFTVDSSTAGTLKLSKVGDNVSLSDGHELTLAFTANEAGDAAFSLSSAQVDIAANAQQDAPNATILTDSENPLTVEVLEAYSVTVELGDNMTASGSLTQTGLTGAMTGVTVTPAEGYELAAPTISPADAGITATPNDDGSYTVSGEPTEDVTVTFEDATLIPAVEPTVEGSADTYFTGYTLITATIEDGDGYVPTYDDNAMFLVEGYEDGTYYYVVAGDYDATKLGYARGTATEIARSADVNETGKVDINDAQYVYNLINGTMTASTAQRLLLADVNRDMEVTTQDCAAIIALIP